MISKITLLITFVILFVCINGQSLETTIKILDMDKFKVFNYSSDISVLNLPPINFITYHINDHMITSYDGNQFDFTTCSKRIAIYIHGYATTDLADGVRMKEALFQGAQHMIDCVVLLDWREWSFELKGDHWWSITPPVWWPSQYSTVARSNLPKVAQTLFDFLQRKTIPSSRLHLIGFSLGAHIAGRASIMGHPAIRLKANRISAIDPAGPIFEHSMDGLYTPDLQDVAIKSDCAEFVDAIHASSLLGMSNNVGNVDHFVTEKECYLPPCTHSKAIDWYIDSILRCSFISCPKEKYQEVKYGLGTTGMFECVNANENEFSSMGFMSYRFPGRGRHDLALYIVYYSTGLDVQSSVYNAPVPCSVYKDLNFTAEKRHCYHPPNWIAECATCRNEKGEPVNFFVMYKLPNSYKYLYLYESRNLEFNSWELSQYGVDDVRSVLGQTLTPLYNQYSKVGIPDLEYVIWNDDIRDVIIEEVPNGHSKGVLAFDLGKESNRVFFLSHSIPRLLADFKFHDSVYSYPESGRLKAQHAICMSMTINNPEIVQILEGLTKFKPLVVSTSQNVMRDQPMMNVMNILQNPPRRRYGEPLHHQIPLNNGFHISISARTKNPNAVDHIKRIADDVYQGSVKAQTWLLGSGEKWSSDCTGFPTVENVKKVDFASYLSWRQRWNMDFTGWETSKDHSKWFVSKSDNNPFVCLGDLNRMRSTMARGGLFLCTKSVDVYHNFKNLPTEIEECPGNIDSINVTSQHPNYDTVDDIKWLHGRHVVWSYNCDIKSSSVLETRTMTRAEDCAPLCVETIGCVAFAWHDSECSLKSSGRLVDAFKTDHGVCGVTTFKEVEDQDSSIQWKDGYHVVWSYNCEISPGHSDLQSKIMTKAEECAPWCRTISECKAFFWRDNTCFLKSEGSLHDTIPWDHGVCGLKMSGESSMIFWRHGNRVVWNNNCEINDGYFDFEEKSMTRAEDCAPWCLSNRNCRSFNWRDNTCFLKKSGNLRDGKRRDHGVCGVTLRRNIQYLDSFVWEHGTDVVWSNGCDIKHNDLSNKQIIRAEECGQWCVQTYGCQAYVWENGNCLLKTAGDLRDAVKSDNAVCGVKVTK